MITSMPTIVVRAVSTSGLIRFFPDLAIAQSSWKNGS